MNTHFHLVVKIELLEAFAKGLQKVKWEYTRRFNAKVNRQGPLWRERYKSILIENERYLAACGQYVENNPVRAGMVREGVFWKYSSAGHYETGKKDCVVDDYDWSGVPVDVDPNNWKEFEKGQGIGSSWFKYCLKNKI